MLKILKTGPFASLRRIIFIAALAVVSSVESLSAGNPQEPVANAATTSIPVTELIAGLKATESAIQSLSAEYTVESSIYLTKPGEPLSDEVLEGHLIQDDAVVFFKKGTALFVATADGRLRNNSIQKGRLNGSINRKCIDRP